MSELTDIMAKPDTYTHGKDGRVCTLLAGEWVVMPGDEHEGYGCERLHGPTVNEWEEQVRELRAVLAMYADPESYHAIGFWFDPPCGEFADDFSEDHGDPFYGRAMPGARARAALLGTTETPEETTT